MNQPLDCNLYVGFLTDGTLAQARIVSTQPPSPALLRRIAKRCEELARMLEEPLEEPDGATVPEEQPS